MTQTMNTEALPEGMALVETHDGRWFPVFAPPGENPLRWVHLIGGPLDIPPALDLDPSEGYQVREEAIGACWAWHEAAILPLEWERLAAHIEVYPERTAWYLDEIARMTENGRLVRLYETYAFATVTTTPPQANEVVTARGATPDEVIETLYRRVYEWYCQQHTLLQRASEHIPHQNGSVSAGTVLYLRACVHVSKWKEIMMRSTAQRNQAVEPIQPPSVKKLLKVKDVADILGVSPVKVYALLKTGLPSLKIDGARRFHPDKLQAWIEQQSA